MLDPRSLGRFALALGVVLPALALSSCGGEEQAALGEAEVEEARDPDAPGLHQLGPNEYEAVIYAFEGGFDPMEVRVPAGASVSFRLRSLDIPHGFYVDDAGVKLIVVQDEFRQAAYTFSERGEHAFFCDEYCGGGHELMRGRVIVE